jgi:hypothetical protein
VEPYDITLGVLKEGDVTEVADAHLLSRNLPASSLNSSKHVAHDSLGVQVDDRPVGTGLATRVGCHTSAHALLLRALEEREVVARRPDHSRHLDIEDFTVTPD